MTLLYTVDVPQRDFSLDLTMTMSELDPQNSTIDIDLGMSGPNGTLSMSGQFSNAGGAVTVRVNGNVFATITSGEAGEPAITGADGQPLSEEDVAALSRIFEMTDEAFISFDEMVAPVNSFLEPAA